MSDLSMPSLMARAQQIRAQGLDVPGKLNALRAEVATTAPAQVRPFDAFLQAHFRDVYGGKPPPPVSLTSAGHANNFGFGGAKGSALSFHQLQAQSGIATFTANMKARIPAMTTTTAPPIPLLDQFPPLSSTQKAEARKALTDDLSSSSARAPDGKRTSILEKLEKHPGLNAEQKTRILDVLSEIKRGYGVVGAEVQKRDPPTGGVGYQDVNWKHTRLELARVLDVAMAKGLSPRDTEVAILASALSDSVKTPGNFLVHNVHGAEAAVAVLGRKTLPAAAGIAADLVEDVARAVLEHQIGPPGFMANVAMRFALLGAKVDAAVVASITAKVADPLNPKNQTADHTEIAFTDVEKKALAQVGIAAWTVPHAGSRHEKAARAVIDADSLVNYACPDGWGKIAALHGPDAPPFLQEPTWKDALTSQDPLIASALKSFFDARSVISDDVKPLYDQGRRRTEQAIDRVEAGVERWLKMQKDPPHTQAGKLPYHEGAPDQIDPAMKQRTFAIALRDEVVKLLREQENIG
ncbi:MAG: hypothetical protein Q8O67_06300 [Deltaproteobacteria bacterium]|nr:hypothetical protein [Deltaproteobacteria bacterium]